MGHMPAEVGISHVPPNHLPTRIPPLSAALSLLPAGAGPARTTVGHDGTAPLDVVHDHVVRLLGDTGAARAVLVDAILRANARAADLGEAPTVENLLRQAHARLASVPTEATAEADRPEPADPVAKVVARAMAVPSRRSAAVLDLTARHGLDLRTVADVLAMDRTHAARARTEALQQVRAAVVAAGGTGIDVEASLAALPLVTAPSTLHELLDDATSPSALHRWAWLTPVVATLALAATIGLGVPRVGAAAAGDVPVAAAQTVEQGPAVQQLRGPTTIPTDEVEQLDVTTGTSPQAPAPAASPQAETAAEDATDDETTPAPSPSPAPDGATDDPADETVDEPSDEPSDEPDDEPSESPLERLLPTGP